MQTVADVIEMCARVAEGWDSGAPIAKDIRALADQYENCIVAEGEPDCCISTEDGWPRLGDGENRFPLYRAKESETCKPALQVEAAEPVAAQHRFRHPQKGCPDWSVWQPCEVRNRPAWDLDSQGYEVEYRALYTARPLDITKEPTK